MQYFERFGLRVPRRGLTSSSRIRAVSPRNPDIPKHGHGYAHQYHHLYPFSSRLEARAFNPIGKIETTQKQLGGTGRVWGPATNYSGP